MKYILYFFTFILLLACNSTEKKKEVNTSERKESDSVKETFEVKVNAKGESMAEIAFEPRSISVPSNSKVILTLENKSSAAGMLHNFVLIELGSGQEIAAAGLKAGKEKEFIPQDKRVIAHTKITEMGETTTIEFDAPPKGSYHYICTYPGHTNMIGRLNVN